MLFSGSIPTRAGKPHGGEVGEQQLGVYPHACGETACWFCSVALATGLSPRVRGNRDANDALVMMSGSIPTRAGKPPAPR